ncbi:MAG: type II toxin-antitoxin system RelE/ParE family toxin [Chlorobi bacterium]|nr:type II toxin-antitoxin system RelE/ParE family toxin [Chlorobiota bacterium]
MGLEIIWSKRAEKGFGNIVKYLEENWTEREIKNFIKEAVGFFELLSKNPKILQPSRKSNLHRGPMNRLTIITYRIKLLISLKKASV